MIAQRQENFLSFSKFSNLTFWDYYTLSNQGKISSTYEIVPLSEVISLRKEFITIDDNTEYKRCRVQLYGKGVVLRDKVLGRELKTKKQQLCKVNDFLVAEIDAKFGGYGTVPMELEDAIVSAHYFLFEIDEKKLLHSFLSLLLKCEGFFKQVKATGSTNYAAIRPYHVLNYLIPLPGIKTQSELVKQYERTENQAEKLSEAANEIENKIYKYLLDQLGIEIKKSELFSKGINLINYKGIGRWAVDYLKNQNSILALQQGKYPVISVKEFLNSYQYGISVKATKEKIGIPMLRMNNIFKGETVVDDLKYINLNENNKKDVLLNKGDLLFNRTNSKELVGKTSVFEEEGEYTFASYLIRLKLDTSKVDVHYINYLFNSQIGRMQIDMVSRQILGQANINTQELREFILPIPPLDLQLEIAAKIKGMKEEIKELRKEAERLTKEASEEFEKNVFEEI